MQYDRNKDYDKKSYAELIIIRTRFERAVIRRPHGTFNEHLQFVQMKIAERIEKTK